MKQLAQRVPEDYWQKWSKTCGFPSPSPLLKLTSSLFPNSSLIIKNLIKHIQEHLASLSLVQNITGGPLHFYPLSSPVSLFSNVFLSCCIFSEDLFPPKFISASNTLSLVPDCPLTVPSMDLHPLEG